MTSFRMFDLLRLVDATIVPTSCKIHFAQWNGTDNPLDVYLAGRFDEWQSWQRRCNFEREYLVSLIELAETERWLFVGVYRPGQSQTVDGEQHYADMRPLDGFTSLSGRLVIRHGKEFRQPYPFGETCAESMHVDEIMREPTTVAHFPGYRRVDISYQELLAIVRGNLDSWRGALASVAGVYLISDIASQRLYVGSAAGEGGIWARWTSYAGTGHGGNVALAQLMKETGIERAASMRFSVLEVADIHTAPGEVIERESHWKRVLLTRTAGLNRN